MARNKKRRPRPNNQGAVSTTHKAAQAHAKSTGRRFVARDDTVELDAVTRGMVAEVTAAYYDATVDHVVYAVMLRELFEHTVALGLSEPQRLAVATAVVEPAAEHLYGARVVGWGIS